MSTVEDYVGLEKLNRQAQRLVDGCTREHFTASERALIKRIDELGGLGTELSRL